MRTGFLCHCPDAHCKRIFSKGLPIQRDGFQGPQVLSIGRRHFPPLSEKIPDPKSTESLKNWGIILQLLAHSFSFGTDTHNAFPSPSRFLHIAYAASPKFPALW